LERSEVQPESVEEIFMGHVISANTGQAPARQAAINAGLPNHVPCTSINKVCASGMKGIYPLGYLYLFSFNLKNAFCLLFQLLLLPAKQLCLDSETLLLQEVAI